MEDKSDIEEIALAISILTGLSIVLFEIVEYFNNNIVRYSPDLISIIYFLVMGLLIEMTIIFSFLILKGQTITSSDKEDSSRITNWLFKLFFKGLIGLSAFSVTILLFIFIYNIFKAYDILENPIISKIATIASYITMIYILYQISILIDLDKKIFYDQLKKLYELRNEHRVFLFFALILYLIAPTYLLMGNYSIDVFPQSNVNDDTLTFTIKETGISYNNIYINLYKLNSSSGIFWFMDNVTINNAKEAQSTRRFMLGKNYDGVWYLNINTSILQPGNYLLHTEVTNDFSKGFLGIEISKKQADKLFNIPHKNGNYSFDSTQTP